MNEDQLKRKLAELLTPKQNAFSANFGTNRATLSDGRTVRISNTVTPGAGTAIQATDGNWYGITNSSVELTRDRLDWRQSKEEEPNPPYGEVKILFSIYNTEDKTEDYYVGGDRAKPILLKSFSYEDTTTSASALVSTGKGLNQFTAGILEENLNTGSKTFHFFGESARVEEGIQSDVESFSYLGGAIWQSNPWTSAESSSSSENSRTMPEIEPSDAVYRGSSFSSSSFSSSNTVQTLTIANTFTSLDSVESSASGNSQGSGSGIRGSDNVTIQANGSGGGSSSSFSSSLGTITLAREFSKEISSSSSSFSSYSFSKPLNSNLLSAGPGRSRDSSKSSSQSQGVVHFLSGVSPNEAIYKESTSRNETITSSWKYKEKKLELDSPQAWLEENDINFATNRATLDGGLLSIVLPSAPEEENPRVAPTGFNTTYDITLITLDGLEIEEISKPGYAIPKNASISSMSWYPIAPPKD